jgi:tight adherence protein B
VTAEPAGTVTVFAAALFAGAAAWSLGEREQGLRRARFLLMGGQSSDPRRGWGRLLTVVRGFGREWLCLPVGAVVALLGGSPLPLIAGALAVPLARRELRARERGRSRERRVAEVIALCSALAGELRTGRQPAAALLVAARDSDGLGRAVAAVLAAARFGGDVPDALRTAAREPGADGLSGLAACWSVAVDSGAGLAAGVERLEEALRSERDQREDLRAQMAGARSTAVLLAVLPVLGILLGTALGADPLYVLLHTPAGLACLLAGGLLEAAGVWWAMRIVRGAAGERRDDGVPLPGLGR